VFFPISNFEFQISLPKYKISEADYTFTGGSYLAEQLKVVRFSGRETISEPFCFEVELASKDHAIDFDALLGKNALMSIHGPKGKRYINAIINRFEHIGKGARFSRYLAELRPLLWLLSYRKNLRIFQEMNAPDIIKKILNEGNISGDQVRFSLKKSYDTREYCVQYRESNLNFISRLMEEEGIFYFFEHHKDKHVMVIGDDPAVHISIASPEKVLYHPPRTALVAEEEYISQYKFSKEIVTEAIKLKDFDFKKPRLNLESSSMSGENQDLEAYDYPGGYTRTDQGKQLARVRLEEKQSIVKTGWGKSDCRRLAPGFCFTLDEHPIDDFNRGYLIVALRHEGQHAQCLEAEAEEAKTEGKDYLNEFECIPSDTPFRPARLTPVPVVQGPQTAMVVGPKGEELYTDEHGRIKVQFHWDREGKNDEKSSCWIRVSQGWAGPGWGMMFMPRIGQEVIVDFIEGDPDRPIVTGRVYNGENKAPYELPKEKTKSTILSNSSHGGGGDNEIRFEDKKGQEEIYIHAQKDKNIKVDNNRSALIGVDDRLDVDKGNRSIKVLNGTYDLQAMDIKLTATNSIEIVCSIGSIKIDSAGNLSINGLNVDSVATAVNTIKGAMVKIN
jgi:type VI secretion system secreted protein VgrG